MKKIVKILLIVLSLLIVSNLNYTYANEEFIGPPAKEQEDFIGPIKPDTSGGIDPFTYSPSDEGIDSDAVIKHVGPFKSILYVLSIVLAVISVSVVGFKYMIGSTQERAEYQKLAIPVIVGILIITCLFSIIPILANLASIF